MAQISISIVSHLQGDWVADLLKDLEKFCAGMAIEVILTHNLPEKSVTSVDGYAFPVKVIRNQTRLGFAENHNQAFKQTAAPYFCVMNPDIRLQENPFPALLNCMENSKVGLVAPMVVGAAGQIEDNARRFPTPQKILCKAFGKCKGSDYLIGTENIYPDWVAGMFMLFRREVYDLAGGFDERYFLYYEDVDLCDRLRQSGYEIVLCPKTRVMHFAQRRSHRDVTYLMWHLRSMLRFFISTTFRRQQCRADLRK